ncbi:MAG: hypothetical protein QM796_01540 [Chthoniobacteraceae bacterium]
MDTTRKWLEDNGWDSYFNFTKSEDLLFSRYPFPGKAHTDYWDDAGVFNHFFDQMESIKNLRGEPINADAPGNKWWWQITSWVMPYVICYLLFVAGVCWLVETLEPFVVEIQGFWPKVGSVIGLSCLLMGITVMSRIARLVKFGKWWLVGVGAFVLGSLVYCAGVDPHVHWDVAVGLGPLFAPTIRVVIAGAIIAIGGAIFSKLWPNGGMLPLMVFATVASAFIIHGVLAEHLARTDNPLWPLLLAVLGFLYLWRLAALIFDLSFIWHRYIRANEAVNFLRDKIYRK